MKWVKILLTEDWCEIIDIKRAGASFPSSLYVNWKISENEEESSPTMTGFEQFFLVSCCPFGWLANRHVGQCAMHVESPNSYISYFASGKGISVKEAHLCGCSLRFEQRNSPILSIWACSCGRCHKKPIWRSNDGWEEHVHFRCVAGIWWLPEIGVPSNHPF